MFEKVEQLQDAKQQIAQLEHRLAVKGSILILLSISVILAVVCFYFFDNSISADYSLWSLLLLGFSCTAYILAIPALYQFKRHPQQNHFFALCALFITLTWVSLAFTVYTFWQDGESAQRILLIGFFIFLLGWSSHTAVIIAALAAIVFSYWLIGTSEPNMTVLDQVLSVLKFPLFILIHYFTMRKLLVETKHKYRENIQLLKKLSATLHIDELTQINNRNGFNRNLDSAIQTAQRLQTPLTLVILDIDYFKQYNDSLGHPKGDQCLIDFAKVLNDNCQRAVDSVSRIGGEEFAFILTGSNCEQASQYIEKIKRELSIKAIAHPLSKASEYVTFSAGIALFDHQKDDQESLYQKADKALYKAKENGRNRYEIERKD